MNINNTNTGHWLAWVRDESQAASSKEEKEKVIELYKTALKDYLCMYYCRNESEK